MPLQCKGCGRFSQGCIWDLDSRALAPAFYALVIVTILAFGIYLVASSDEESRKLEIGTGFIGLAIGLPFPGIKFKLNAAAEEQKVKEAEKRLRRLERLEHLEREVTRGIGDLHLQIKEGRRDIPEGRDDVEGRDVVDL